MKIGMLVNSQYVAGESMPVKIQESVEQVRAARDAGFDIICAPQHYLTAPYQMSATMPLLARLAGEAGEMEIATAIVLLPLHNPVEMAESVATMDAICGGRFIFGIGLGYRDEEYTAFGMDRSQRVGRAREALEVMKLLWSEGEVEFHGKYYNVPKVQTATRPVQQPHPPIWVAANADAAIRRAARWGYPWLINPHVTVATVAEQLSAYRRLAAEAGHADVQSFPMMRELYVAQDRETAFLESRPYLESKYAAYAAWGQDKVLPGEETFSVPYPELAADRFLLGSPDDVAGDIQRYGQELGVDYMIFRMQWPGMSHRQCMEQIDIMGREVIPRVRAAG